VKVIGSITGVFWTLCLGAVALFVFFWATGLFSPTEVLWLSIVVGALAVLSLIHFLRVRRALGDPRHSDLARTVHSMRERRGF
jgi:membrane protein implicated in regulation of membrane protease activity